MHVFIESDTLYDKEINYTFNLFAKNKELKYKIADKKSGADLIISHSEDADIRISKSFYENLKKGKYLHTDIFKDKCEFIDPQGYIDYLSTAFYIVNCLQEYGDSDDDIFGRFKYKNSLQFKFGNVRLNIVQVLFDKLWISTEKLSKLNVTNYKSEIYLSHDIDTIYGSLLQDSFFSIKKFRPDLLFLVFLENILNRPSWFNIDKIMKIENEFEFTSTFYWLVNKGKTEYGLNNSDYDINSVRIIKTILAVNDSKWENGLHKSASEEPFKNELAKLPCSVIGNRYHYIKFKPHKNFPEIENAGLKLDASLGFADAPGFRNGYGRPFHPFNLKERRPYDFLEVPLNIMDTTYFNYLKYDSQKFTDDVIDFVELNSYNAVISVLFHNNFISSFKYKNYFNAFKKLLSFFYESGFKSISQRNILERY